MCYWGNWINSVIGDIMRIAWLKEDFKGGANVSNSLMIKKGKELGYEIDEITPKDLVEGGKFANMKLNWDLTMPSEKRLETYDLIVLSNINTFKTEIIEWIIKNKKYVTLNHDYAYCRTRSAMCKPKCVPAKIFVDLYANSLLNIFFSPLQLNIHKEVFGETMRDAICIPAPIEKDKWFPNKEIQQDAYLYAGVLATHKGVNQILDFADSQKGNGKIFHFAGKIVNKEIIDRIKKDYTYLGEIPHDEMPNLLRKYKNFIINPIMPETFGLSIIEAMMSGCTIVKFSQTYKTGLESWNLSPTQLIERCSKSSTKFWNEIKRLK